jgi:hypothetical protein
VTARQAGDAASDERTRGSAGFFFLWIGFGVVSMDTGWLREDV